jgi:hypothetical protein
LATAAQVVKENAIAVGQLDKAFALADQTNVALLKIFHTDSQQSRHRLDFGLVDPNIARLPSAAISASGALKTQSKLIPGAWVHNIRLLLYVTANSLPLVFSNRAISGIRP